MKEAWQITHQLKKLLVFPKSLKHPLTMHQFALKFVLYLSLILFTLPSYASKRFMSSYVTFEMGDNWTCKSFAINWICHHYLRKGAKPALILIMAREVTNKDRPNVRDILDLYLQLLKHQEVSKIVTEKFHASKVSIERYTWLDTWYRDVINLFHRRLATFCCDGDSTIQVSVEFLAHEENYTKYSTLFLRSINSLKLVDGIKETLKKIRSQTEKQRADTFSNMLSYIEQIVMAEDLEVPSNKKKDLSFHRFLVWLLLIFLFSGGFYLYYRRRKRRARRRRRRKRRSKKRTAR